MIMANEIERYTKKPTIMRIARNPHPILRGPGHCMCSFELIFIDKEIWKSQNKRKQKEEMEQ